MTFKRGSQITPEPRKRSARIRKNPQESTRGHTSTIKVMSCYDVNFTENPKKKRGRVPARDLL